jgi:polyphenol oxidase
MPFRQSGSIHYYSFESFDQEGVKHAVFTRRGGVSPAPWFSLNVGGTVGDDPARVAENRHLAFQALERDPRSVFDVWQVHSADVVSTAAPRPTHAPHQKADAILTSAAQVTLFMRFADCVPILLYDPVRKVAGLVHAGWQGTIKKTAAAALNAMQAEYKSSPGDILAGIGPSIAAHHYPVGKEVAEQVQAVFGQDASSLLISGNGAVQFDLWAANQLVLENAGVRHIETAGICTACSLENWYSHRAENAKTGRFGALIAL